MQVLVWGKGDNALWDVAAIGCLFDQVGTLAVLRL